MQAGDEIVKLAAGPEQMTVAELSALLYLPGHPRQQLLRALRIPALSPGWQQSFRSMLDGEASRGNAGLTSASPPPAWPGFRRLTATKIERQSSSVISVRFEDADGKPLPAARAGQYITLRIQPDAAKRPLLRNYSMCGPPDAGYYRIAVKREPHGAASGYLHSRLAAGDELDVAAPRGSFLLDDSDAPVLLISAGIGSTPALAMLTRWPSSTPSARSGGCTVHATAASTRSRKRRERCSQRARTRARASTSAGRARATSKAATSTRPVTSALRLCSNSSRRETRRPTSAARTASWTRSAPRWHRSASSPRRSTPSRSGPNAPRRRASRRRPRARRTRRPARRETGRRSNSRAAAWPSVEQ